jgi:hypothetical protein
LGQIEIHPMNSEDVFAELVETLTLEFRHSHCDFVHENASRGAAGDPTP